jgi:hypothetical protein
VASFTFTFRQQLGRIRSRIGKAVAGEKSESKAADRSVRPT